MTPSAEYRGHVIYVAISGIEEDYHVTPVICAVGDPPHAKDARRLKMDKVLKTCTRAMEYGFAAARAWIERNAAP